MNASGYLLDTGPLVALFDQDDQDHEKAKALFSQTMLPFKTCEAVITEACFLLNRAHPKVADQIISLGHEGFYEIPFRLNEHFTSIAALMKKYNNLPISLADACLIRCAELYQEPRILTFDSDFEVYRWGRNKRFTVLK